jgi:hypothetical protein
MSNTERPTVTALALAAVLAVAATAAAIDVPWPRGEAPSAQELTTKVEDAVKLFERERAEEFLEAADKGEDTEHIVVKQEQIDSGRYTPAQLFVFGDSAFEHEFRAENGYGTTRDTHSRRVHKGASGGRDTFSCAGCHSQGGVNGSGPASANSFYFGDGERISSAVVRNPPAVLGLGYVQAVASEMSRELEQQREQAIRSAREKNAAVTVELLAKGVRFGKLTARSDGSVDDGAVEGVDRDLVVKPFGWKGHTARLRRFAERAAQLHFGVQAHTLALEHKRDPSPEMLGWSDKWWDPDDDGVARELEEGTVTALAVYLALLEAPQIIPPAEPELLTRWSRGDVLFDRIGCSDCHRRSMSLVSELWLEKPDTTDGPGTMLDLTVDGEKPRSFPRRIMLFSDLKRHRMGDKLREANDDPDGIGREWFITRPLWGAAETAPYLHDGRAADFSEAILEHGGEAETQRASFEALDKEQQRDLLVFLSSLSREPKLRIDR